MNSKKRVGRPRKHKPTISNTGFLGATFADIDELDEHKYHFSRKSLQVVQHVLDGLLKGATHIFNEHHIPANMSCYYLKKEKKLGLVLSKQPINDKEGEAYFYNYLLERDIIEGEFRDIYSTGFLGVVFIDLGDIDRFTYEFESKLLLKLVKSFLIPAKELFLQHNIKAYISGLELEEQNKIGFVLSEKPYDEKKEAELYFIEYLKERGFCPVTEIDDIPIISSKW